MTTAAPAQTKRTYIYPPRATTAIPRDSLHLLAKAGYIAQLKVNDTHVLLDYDGPELVRIHDRHHGQPVYNHTTALAGPLGPHLRQLGQLLVAHHGPGRHLLDGGLLHSKHATIRDTIALWDVLVSNDRHLLGTTYQGRYEELTELLGDARTEYRYNGERLGWAVPTGPDPRLFIPDTYRAADWDTAWGIVERVNKNYATPLLEGLMLKNPGGRLEPGLRMINNNVWLTRCRVTTGRHRF